VKRLGLPVVAAAQVAESPVTVHVSHVPARDALEGLLRQAPDVAVEATVGLEVTADADAADAAADDADAADYADAADAADADAD
jgi:hypothetical protein